MARYARLLSTVAAGLCIPVIVLLSAREALAIPVDDLVCQSAPIAVTTYFEVGARHCPDGRAQDDSGVCFYTVPCMAMNPALRAEAASLFANTPWARLTDAQRTTFMRSKADQWLPTELSCKAVVPGTGNPPAALGTCPPANLCMRDAYIGMRPAFIDTRAAVPGTFNLEHNQGAPAAGAHP